MNSALGIFYFDKKVYNAEFARITHFANRS